MCVSLKASPKEIKHHPIKFVEGRGYSICHQWIDGTENHLKFDPNNEVTALCFDSPRELLLALMRGGRASRAGYNLFGCFLLRACTRELNKAKTTAAPAFANAKFGTSTDLTGRTYGADQTQMRRKSSLPVLPAPAVS